MNTKERGKVGRKDINIEKRFRRLPTKREIVRLSFITFIVGTLIEVGGTLY